MLTFNFVILLTFVPSGKEDHSKRNITIGIVAALLGVGVLGCLLYRKHKKKQASQRNVSWQPRERPVNVTIIQAPDSEELVAPRFPAHAPRSPERDTHFPARAPGSPALAPRSPELAPRSPRPTPSAPMPVPNAGESVPNGPNISPPSYTEAVGRHENEEVPSYEDVIADTSKFLVS